MSGMELFSSGRSLETKLGRFLTRAERDARERADRIGGAVLREKVDLVIAADKVDSTLPEFKKAVSAVFDKHTDERRAEISRSVGGGQVGSEVGRILTEYGGR